MVNHVYLLVFFDSIYLNTFYKFRICVRCTYRSTHTHTLNHHLPVEVSIDENSFFTTMKLYDNWHTILWYMVTILWLCKDIWTRREYCSQPSVCSVWCVCEIIFITIDICSRTICIVGQSHQKNCIRVQMGILTSNRWHLYIDVHLCIGHPRTFYIGRGSHRNWFASVSFLIKKVHWPN